MDLMAREIQGLHCCTGRQERRKGGEARGHHDRGGDLYALDLYDVFYDSCGETSLSAVKVCAS
jgi:hypothetical protein